MSRRSDGRHVDITVVQKLLDVIRATEDEHVFRFPVWQNYKLRRFPRILNLRG